MAEAFNTYVGNFIKTGNPNGNGLPLWPAFDGQYNLMDFSLDDGPLYGTDSRAEGIRLVERAADAQN
jgi:para-nitrobenzyl esterase